jgi:ABC-type maltose transport system permease subunit
VNFLEIGLHPGTIYSDLFSVRALMVMLLLLFPSNVLVVISLRSNYLNFIVRALPKNVCLMSCLQCLDELCWSMNHYNSSTLVESRVF